MPKLMCAKMRVRSVSRTVGDDGKVASEAVEFSAVAKNESYPPDGLDENNTFAKFTPNAHLAITIANPALFGKLAPGQVFYVDFTPV